MAGPSPQNLGIQQKAYYNELMRQQQHQYNNQMPQDWGQQFHSICAQCGKNLVLGEVCTHKLQNQSELQPIIPGTRIDETIRNHQDVLKSLITKTESIETPEESKMFGIYGNLKNYITKHSDLIFTVFFVMLADKFLFNGAFKETLQGLVGKLITKAHVAADETKLTVAK